MATKSKAIKISQKHLLGIQDLSINDVNIILNQAKEFVKSADIEGAIMTKMDGSAKGGIIFPIYKELELPVRFMGTGEDLDDLTLFDAKEYTQGLLGTKN